MSLALPLAVTWAGAVATAVLDGRRRWVGWLAVAMLAAQLVLLCVLLGTVLSGGDRFVVAGDWPPGVGIVLRGDPLGLLFAVLSTLVLLAALVHELLGEGVRWRAFPTLVLVMASGLTGLYLTGDVFNFYVFFELSMIAGYALSAYFEGARRLGAALIFAIVNLLGSFVFLIGVAALYHVTGTVDMATAAERVAETDAHRGVLIATTFFAAFAIKLALFPFHFWLPAVYAGTRPAVAAMLSGALANIGAYGILRFGGELFARQLELAAPALIGLGLASIVYGAMQAIARRNTVEVLAYSAIGQVGYVLVAVAIGGAIGFSAAIVYSVVNALNKALLFLSTDLRGWLVSAAFAVGALSVAGVPPTAGFVGKLAVFRAGAEDGGAAVVALLVLGGALSFVYMLQIYQHDRWRHPDRGTDSTIAVRAITGTLACLVLALGAWPEPLVAASEQAADALGARR